MLRATESETNTIDRLRKVICQLSRRLNASTLDVGLSPSQVSALMAVGARGPIGIGELAEYEGLNATMTSRIVGKLQEEGLIVRAPDSSDRRAAHVRVTATGRRTISRVRAHRTRALTEALDSMPAHDAEMLLDALASLEGLARKLGIPGADDGLG